MRLSFFQSSGSNLRPPNLVIPARAGIHRGTFELQQLFSKLRIVPADEWVPAFVGMTVKGKAPSPLSIGGRDPPTQTLVNRKRRLKNPVIPAKAGTQLAAN
jgi:hypothetical protein